MTEENKKTLPREFSASKTVEAYAKLSRVYDIWGRLTESKAAAKAMELADIKDGEKILEVAVGTGMLFEEIIRKNRSGENEGMDISPEMLEQARKRLREHSAKSFHLCRGNAYRLPFKAESFDLIVNNFMLDLLPEEGIKVVLSEFYRTLRPSGRVVVSTMAFGGRWYHHLWEWIARKYPALLTNCRPIAVQPYLTEAGFVNVFVEFISQNTFPGEVSRAEKRI